MTVAEVTEEDAEDRTEWRSLTGKAEILSHEVSVSC